MTATDHRPAAGTAPDAPASAWHTTALTRPTSFPVEDAPERETLAARIVARVEYVAWRARCIARSLADGGSSWGCCTCGGTSGTWRITGATAARGVDGEPVEDWTECDRCHADPEVSSGDLPARRVVASLPERIATWLLLAAFLVALIGASGTAEPFNTGLAALILAITSVILWGAAGHLVAAARRDDTGEPQP